MLDLLPMKDVVTIHLDEGYDDWGNPIPLAPKEFRSFVSYNTVNEKIANINGNEIVYSANVYLPYGTKVTYDSKITFTDSVGNLVTKEPEKIQYKKDFWGSPMLLRVVV